MSLARLPLPAIIGLALLGYIAIGLPLALLGDPGISPASLVFSLALPLPIVLFLAAWIGIEIRTGRRIMPRLRPDPAERTQAQARRETRGTMIVIGFGLFMSLAPVAVSIAKGDGLTAMSLAPMLCWAWIWHLNGLTRLRLAPMLMFSPTPARLDTEEVRRFLTGYVLASGADLETDWVASVASTVKEGVPRLTIRAASTGPAMQTLTDAPQAELALMILATGDGDPYRLHFAQGEDLRISPREMSSHARMSALGIYKDAMERIPNELLA